MRIRTSLIAKVLLAPMEATALSTADWDLLVRQGRRTNLLARLAISLRGAGILDRVPTSPKLHLLSALRMVERQDIALRWEIRCLANELKDAGTPFILLKGAAYVMANLPAAPGRTFSDVDILVPKANLNQVESQLMLHGWQGSHHSSYDQQYYRRWMHELPPMTHVLRNTSLDVHHAILPDTARIKVNTSALIAAAQPLPLHPGVYVLQPTDMLLHSATHLFQEGQLENGLRDLFDLDSLLRHFSVETDFWNHLVPRAQELGLTRPLYYALRYTSQLLKTPIPAALLRESANTGEPSKLALAFMDFCYHRALQPCHASCNTRGTRLARTLLYVRSHWMRMPLMLLIPHLVRKALTRPKEAKNEIQSDIALKEDHAA